MSGSRLEPLAHRSRRSRRRRPGLRKAAVTDEALQIAQVGEVWTQLDSSPTSSRPSGIRSSRRIEDKRAAREAAVATSRARSMGSRPTGSAAGGREARSGPIRRDSGGAPAAARVVPGRPSPSGARAGRA
jgi:hypothetical protein